MPRPNPNRSQVNCPPNGVHLYPHHNNCQQYIICVEGTQVIHTCGNFTHFNPVNRVCDLPELAGCVTNGRPIQTVDPHPIIRPQPPTVMPPPTPQCSGDNLFFPSLDDCHRYWMCLGTTPILMSCPRDFLWNDRIHMCDLASRVVCAVNY